MIALNGQPRSGTSMMMRVLQFGGVPIEYNDHPENFNMQKSKDLYRNPYGFFETSKPSHTKCFKCWIPLNKSKVTKDTKIIFIQRELDQQIKSWVNVQPKVDPTERCTRMRKQFEDGLEGYEFLKIRYEDMQTDPRTECERIKEFLKDELDFNVEEAIKAVDSTLFIKR